MSCHYVNRFNKTRIHKTQFRDSDSNNPIYHGRFIDN
jgi:hypothetical protein